MHINCYQKDTISMYKNTNIRFHDKHFDKIMD